MSLSLFRREALTAQRASVLGKILLVRPISFAFLTAAAVCMALAVALLFVFGSYTRRTTVEGIVIPDTGMIKVYAKQSGTVLNKAVAEGQHVMRDAVLYTISTDLQSSADGQTQATLIDLTRNRKRLLIEEQQKTRQIHKDDRDTLDGKLANLQAEIARLDDQIVLQRERVSIAKDGVERFQRLHAHNFMSTEQLQERTAGLLDQQSKLLSLNHDHASAEQAIKETVNTIAGLELKQQNELSKLDRNILETEQSLIENEARREIVVTSPVTGIATAAIAEPGQMTDTTHPMVSIVPDGAKWQVHLFVPSAAAGFVHVGDPVRVRFQAFPYQKFGQYPARVTSIARTALSPAELSVDNPAGNGGNPASLYRVTAALDEQTVTAYGKPQTLQAGMTLQADILQERRQLYEWVLEPLYSLSGKL